MSDLAVKKRVSYIRKDDGKGTDSSVERLIAEVIRAFARLKRGRGPVAQVYNLLGCSNSCN